MSYHVFKVKDQLNQPEVTFYFQKPVNGNFKCSKDRQPEKTV